MIVEKNVGKKEGIVRITIGLVLLVAMLSVEGWLTWACGLAGAALIGTAFAHT